MLSPPATQTRVASLCEPALRCPGHLPRQRVEAFELLLESRDCVLAGVPDRERNLRPHELWMFQRQAPARDGAPLVADHVHGRVARQPADQCAEVGDDVPSA